MHDQPEHELEPLEATLVQGRLFPPPWLLILSVLAVLGILVLNLSGSLEDIFPVVEQAIKNAISALVLVLLSITWLVWFTYFSAYHLAYRISVVLLLVSGFAIFLGLFEVIQMTGGLLPSGFRYRFARRHDESLEKLPARNAAVIKTGIELSYELAEGEVDQNSHQFFGPQRDGNIPVTLETDWSKDTNLPEEIWRQPIGAGWSGFAAAGGYLVTMEQRDNAEYTSCYELATGKIVWSHAEMDVRHVSPMGGIGPRCTPTIDPATGNVYAVGATGILLALKGSDGELLWRKEILKEVGSDLATEYDTVTWGRAASPLIYQNLVIVPGGGKVDPKSKQGKFVSLIAFDKLTGDEIWRGGTSQISYSSPMVAKLHDREMILIVNESSVAGHDPATGTQLWEHQREGSSNTGANVSQPVLLPENQLLLTKGYGLGAELIQLNKTQEGYQVASIWKNNRSLRTKFTSVLAKGEYVYGLNDGIMECVNLRSGKRAWIGGRYGHGQVLLAGDALLVLSEQGRAILVAADPEGHREFGSKSLIESVTWNIPTIHQYDNNWYLVVRNAQEAACFRLKTSP
jgi:outer membrane protein assembly factor BamB